MRAPRPQATLLLLAACLAGAAGLAVAGCGAVGRAPEDATGRPVATVNGRAISGDQFDRFVRVKLGEFAGERLDDVVRSELFDEFVKREVTAQAARERGLAVAPAAADGDAPAARPALAEQATDMLVERYYREVVLKNVTVSPDEVASFYAANRASYCPAEGYYVRELRASSREEIERLRREIASGRAGPDGAAGEVASHLYEPAALPPQFRRAVAPLGDGEISPVVRSTFGYHVFVRERCGDDAEPPPRVRERVASDLRATKNERLVSEAVERLLREATVEVDPGRLSFNYEGRFAPRN